MLRRAENWLPWVPGVIFLIITGKIAQWSVMCEALTRRTGVSQDKLKVACVRASPTRYFFARDGGVIIMLIITTRRARLICHDLFSLFPHFCLDIHISVLNILMAIMPKFNFYCMGFWFFFFKTHW